MTTTKVRQTTPGCAPDSLIRAAAVDPATTWQPSVPVQRETPEPRLRSTDLGALVDRVRVDLEPDVRAAGGRVLRHPLPTLCADPALLRVALTALVRNAIDSRRLDSDPLVTLSAERVDGAWRILACDNGVGVPIRDRGPLVHTGRVRGCPREGGLSAVLDVARAHGGRLGIEDSRLGPGATVWIEIPDRGTPVSH